jgi:hypothetical protein
MHHYCFLYNVQEVTQGWSFPDICTSVRIHQVDNKWMVLDKIWYGKYANGSYPKLVILIFYN